MTEKIISLLIAALMCLIAPALPDHASPAPDLSGRWMDSWSQRAHLELTRDGETYSARIRWANSAFEHVEWNMSGVFEEGVLTAENATKTSHSYDEEGTETVVILYENQPASLTLTGSVITWQDVEGVGSECRFEQMPDGE